MIRADWVEVTAWQKLLLGLALCLPIPALSLSGLAVPLPGAVYRAAAAFVESTQDLAAVFTGGDANATSESPIRSAAIGSPPQRVSAPAARPRAVAGAAAARASAERPERSAPERARRFGGATAKASPEPAQPADRRRIPSVPATEPGSVGSNAATDAPAPSAPARGASQDRPATEPTPKPADVVPVQPPPVGPPADPSPPLPPARPPDPVTQPLQPVTDALQPVTNALQPVTSALQPVTNALQPVTDTLGRLGLFVPRSRR